MQRRLDWTCTPRQVVAAWPQDRPLMVLHSGGVHPRWARRTLIAAPCEFRTVEDGGSGAAPPAWVNAGRWIGYLGYGLGRVLEPAVGPPRVEDDRGWPLAGLGRCPQVLHYDHIEGRWVAGGEGDSGAGLCPDRFPDEPPAWRAGPLAPAVEPDAYLAMVAAAIEAIARGDIFQANITHRLTAPFAGSTRGLLMDAMERGGAWYGAYLELPGGRCLLSLSPELFLDADMATRDVVTRPIKGTRPVAAARGELLRSEKDAAELNMIVDLMRNDLGRVCEYGSVRVPRGRAIETHPTVHHGVGEVTGRLRAGVTPLDLLAATFPPGSVTGAPKIRAMQIIDELEPVARGPYCGAIGILDAAGRSTLNVAIRTAALTGRRTPGDWSRLDGVLDYGVGGGIVADSEPVAEYRETMDKAVILRRLLGQPSAVSREPPPVGREHGAVGRLADG